MFSCCSAAVQLGSSKVMQVDWGGGQFLDLHATSPIAHEKSRTVIRLNLRISETGVALGIRRKKHTPCPWRINLEEKELSPDPTHPLLEEKLKALALLVILGVHEDGEDLGTGTPETTGDRSGDR